MEQKSDLESVVAKCLAGDGRAWAQLVDRYQKLVYSVPRRMGLNEEDSSDIFQNTFLALHRNLDRIDCVETLPKWLSVTAAREAYKLLNSRNVKNTTLLPDQDLEDLLVDEQRSIDEQIHLSLLGQSLQAGLGRLQDKCKGLLIMLYLEENPSYQEISDRLSLPLGSIGPTRARCLEKLRSVLRKDRNFSDMYHEHNEIALPV